MGTLELERPIQGRRVFSGHHRRCLQRNEISSLVIDTLRNQCSGQNVAVLGLYCDYQAQGEQSAVNMIGGLLRQVDWRETGIRNEIRSAFNQSKSRGGQGLRMSGMLKLFVKVASFIDRVYICVDAVDELLPKNRLEFLRGLRQITQDAPNTRLFLTARPSIQAELDRKLEGVYVIKIVADQGDIARYLNHKIDGDEYPDLMTENLKNDIIRTMLGKSSDM